MSHPPDRPYAAVPGHWDEMALPDGSLRPDWRTLMDSLRALGPEELRRRWQEGQRQIQENGVTYNVYGDPRGMDRPWVLDPIPMVISSDEWAFLETAVAQRATLLDRILADLYGPARLLHERHLPPEVVYAHPGFLRPCRGLTLAEDRHLHVYAADLARSPDGRWWVIADRTQAPSGAGYALENRVVTGRILPEAFGAFHVRRLAGYFQAYRDTLVRVSPGDRDNPRVVLLTPGPYNETYFEHAYLSRYLGLTLVEGADLTVRDERVYLKTLSGLLPVDVVLRRQDDAWCDPLELLGESALGVPGLVQAVRAGNVTIANALGSGLVETAAIMAFLPGLCRALLGEELRMPSVATWWCGQERERSYVTSHLDEVVIKPAFPAPGHEVVFGSGLSRRERAHWVDVLRARPHAWVAQEQVSLSTAPTTVGESTSPRHVVLRVYAVAGADGYHVMPGGLTRVSSASDSLVVSSQRGGGSKDTWVISDAPVPFVSLMDRVTRPVDVSRASFALTSRVADDLLWLGRMSSRVEAGVRAFRCALRRLAEEPIRAADATAPDALRLLGRLGWLGPEVEPESGVDDAAVLAALFDRDRPDALGSAVGQLHRIASLLRDRISNDAWRFLSRLDQKLTPPDLHPARRVAGTLDLLDDGLMALLAFTGLVMEGTTRGLGWQFLDIGRRLERAVQIVDLLREGVVEDAPVESRRLDNVLEIADSRMTYRSRYQTSVQVPLVIDLLLLDENNPRSIVFQLARLGQRFASLPRAPGGEAAALLERVRTSEVTALAELHGRGRRKRREGLAALLAELTAELPTLSDALGHAYLSHAVPRRQPSGVRSPA